MVRSTPESVGVNGLWRRGQDGWAVGYGSARRWNGQRWSPTPLPLENGRTRLNDVWGSGTGEAFAVGVDGTALSWDGARWEATETGTKSELIAVVGNGSDDVIAVGRDGLIHWDGRKWSRLWASGGYVHVAFARSSHEIYAVIAEEGSCKGAALRRWDGSGWVKLLDVFCSLSASETTWTTFQIWGRSADDLWFASTTEPGAFGADVMHWDGRAWTHPDVGRLESLSGGHSADDGSVWVLGNRDARRWDGRSWSKVALPTPPSGMRGDGEGGLLLYGYGIARYIP